MKAGCHVSCNHLQDNIKQEGATSVILLFILCLEQLVSWHAELVLTAGWDRIN